MNVKWKDDTNEKQIKDNIDELKMNESDQFYQSPSFSKKNFGKEDNKNEIENYKFNEYSFKA